MTEKVLKVGIKRKTGWLYYLDKNINVYRVRMLCGGEKKKRGQRLEVVLKTGIKCDQDYLYYVDKTGDISRVKTCRGGTARQGKDRLAAKKKEIAAKQACFA